MNSLEECQAEIKRLEKQMRILEKRLHRSDTDRVRLEKTNRNKESLLKRVIIELQESQAVLEKKSMDLESAFNDLKLMQDKLVETEKMAALGSLVAGVAHEINTPVGTSLTLASTLLDETHDLQAIVQSGQIKRSVLNHYLEVATESATLILSNLNRAGELVQSFKQVAVDQSSEGLRVFKVKAYLEEVVTSLLPVFRSTHLKVTVTGDDSVEMYSYPGALAQVATNLLTNSFHHAYLPDQVGHLCFEVSQQSNEVLIRYSDDGQGIPEGLLDRVFDPFFTTAREKGGTGLGLHITYNLVTQKLQGRIDVKSQLNHGTDFQIQLPLNIAP